MKKSIVLLAALGLGALAATPASAERMVLQFLGESTNVGHAGDVNTREGTGIDFEALDVDPADFVCFETDLLNPNTDTLLGTGVDCLRFDDPETTVNVLADTLTVTAISFFIMPGGTVVSMGTTSVQPMVDGFGNGGTPTRTHITGSIPDDNAMDGIIAVTGEFDSGNGGDPAGSARVSGSIALDQATPFFDCLWVVNVVSASANGQAHGKPFQ